MLPPNKKNVYPFSPKSPCLYCLVHFLQTENCHNPQNQDISIQLTPPCYQV